MSAGELYVLPIAHGRPTEGIPLMILRETLEDPPAPFTRSTFSALLGLDTSAAKKAIQVLIELGYLTAKIGPPTVYRLTEACMRLLATSPTQSAPIPRDEAMRAATGLLETCGRGNAQESLCRVVAVTFFGVLLDDSIAAAMGVSAQITVRVRHGAGAAQAMRDLESRLLGVHDIVQLHFVLVVAE